MKENQVGTNQPVQLTPNFKSTEFACHCGCGFDAVDPNLVAGLQKLRDRLGKPIQIMSACRCAAHNAAQGGAKRSQHMLGKAADIRVTGMDARSVYDVAHDIEEFRGFGVSDEHNFVHIDVRDQPAKWCYLNGREVTWHA